MLITTIVEIRNSEGGQQDGLSGTSHGSEKQWKKRLRPWRYGALIPQGD